jgi:GT2 family glycosyltransferase
MTSSNNKPEIETFPLISVIIVNYNGLRFLENCLASLKKQTYPANRFEIIVVDNGSADDSIAFIRNNSPEVKIIEARKNLGFAAGNNLGFKHAKGDFFALLNNDTEVPENWLSGLADSMLKSKSIGLVTCKILFHGDRQTINSTGLELLRDGRGSDRGFREKDSGQYNQIEDVFGACGASVLLRKEMLTDIGYFDERLFMYYEDLDLAWRAKLRNWRCVYTPETVVYHIHCGSSGEWSNFFTYHVERNRALVCVKNAPLGMALRCVSIVAIKSCIRIIQGFRGIFSTIYAKPKKEISEQAINELVGKFYKDKPFIRLVDHLPSTKDSVGTNYVDLHYKVAGDYIVVLAAEDNLIRGASGVAIQNFNLMFGFPEVTALLP